MNDIRAQIKNFIIDNFMFGDSGGIEDGVSFLDSGIIDSTGILELVTFLEETFKITVKDDEMIPENLGSIAAIVSLPDTSSGNRRRASAVNYILSPQTHADDRRQKILGKDNNLNYPNAPDLSCEIKMKKSHRGPAKKSAAGFSRTFSTLRLNQAIQFTSGKRHQDYL